MSNIERKKKTDVKPTYLPMFGVPNNIDEAIEYAAKLQKGLCCYRTADGDGRPCDCKFLGAQDHCSMVSENTGCCEARALIRFLQGLRDKE